MIIKKYFEAEENVLAPGCELFQALWIAYCICPGNMLNLENTLEGLAGKTQDILQQNWHVCMQWPQKIL